MSLMRRSPAWPFVFAFTPLFLVACGNAGPAPTGTPTSTPTPSASPVGAQGGSLSPTGVADTSTPVAAQDVISAEERAVLSSEGRTAVMNGALGYLSASGEVDTSLIRHMGDSGDTAFVPVLLDLLFFAYVIPLGAVDEMNAALVKLTGEDLRDQGWPGWFEWLGKHPEVRAPAGYAGWKGQIYSLIDPDFSLFLHDGVEATIRTEEIVWGGVRKDGIPDLTDAPVIAAVEATYLNPDDRVFGVSINGEHRAYPLRIVNAHEMANDILGGEPIALAY